MKKILLLLALALTAIPALTAEMADSDAGIYETLNGIHYRLSQTEGKWTLADKEAGGPLAKLDCASECDYRKTTEAEIQSYFSATMLENLDVVCIQNMVMAFCRYNPKSDPTKKITILLALFDGKAALIPIRQIEQQ